eukprot:3159995-Rhodomonas_salina.6
MLTFPAAVGQRDRVHAVATGRPRHFLGIRQPEPRMFGYGVLGFGFWVGIGNGVWGLGFRVSGLAYRMIGPAADSCSPFPAGFASRKTMPDSITASDMQTSHLLTNPQTRH